MRVDFRCESLVGSDIRMGMAAPRRSIGGRGLAGGGDIMAPVMNVMLDGERWRMAVDSDATFNGRGLMQERELLW